MNVESFVVREFRPDDLEKVIDINRICLPENYPAFFFMDHYRNYPKAFLVAEVEGEVVGYVMCRIEWGLSYFKYMPTKLGHVISLAVLPHARRKGLGTNLMLTSMKAMKEVYGAKEFYLEVRVSNLPAIRLYERLGFRVVRIIRGYYSDGEDAYVMARPA
ncbi:MAG: ribosomal-protein-alanine N-acetyltransferase [Thermoprotei archaeon]|nr:MAG: ribosomal-protein-alanine N-acetyltransferase [Thermoprotei archaeon]RLF02873.1 MAG: ribosomal-protein-alanine N-acetyltransferase [Thermoprotei archaeon]